MEGHTQFWYVKNVQNSTRVKSDEVQDKKLQVHGFAFI